VHIASLPPRQNGSKYKGVKTIGALLELKGATGVGALVLNVIYNI
jgi:hypothetical protein